MNFLLRVCSILWWRSEKVSFKDPAIVLYNLLGPLVSWLMTITFYTRAVYNISNQFASSCGGPYCSDWPTKPRKLNDPKVTLKYDV